MISLVIGIFCFFVVLIVGRGSRRPLATRDDQPPVSILVTARDEEATITACINSLVTQDYPRDKLKIVFVNHLSVDRTGELMDDFARRYEDLITVIHVKEEDEEYKGKVQGLLAGIDVVDTEYLLITDGDCIVPTTWASSMMAHFTDELDAIGGLVTVERLKGQERPVEHLQHVDHWYYIGMMAGLTNACGPGIDKWCLMHRLPKSLHKLAGRYRPVFLIGNNIGIRISTYDQVGGYRAIGSTVIEDFALVNRLMKNSRGAFALVLDNGARVVTTPVKKFKTLWRQKRRWAAALRFFNPVNSFLYALLFLIRIVVPWLVFVWPLESIAALVLMAAADWIVIKRVSSRIGDKVHTWEILMQEFYQIILNHLLLLAWLIRWPVVWKGQIYRKPR